MEQSQIGKSGFASELINNTLNIIAVNEKTHGKITGHYNSIIPNLTNGMRVRDWLAGQSFKAQYEYGLDVLRRYGVIK